MAKTITNFDLKQYAFKTDPVPRLSVNDPETSRRISKALPVVITDTHLVQSAMHWNLEYLADHIGDGKFTVYTSKNKNFKYFDEKKATNVKKFQKPMESVEMKFTEFVNKLKSAKSGEDRIYLQQTLNDEVGKRVVADFLRFNWSWVTEQSTRNKYGPLTANLLLIGMEGNITPAHYDEQENFFAQVQGYKRFILFPPSQFKNLYPYPIYHPCDRQSQVNFDDPDFERFPLFKETQGLETVVGPGDVLFIPNYWWHQVESIPKQGYTMSITFWYKSGPTDKVEYPLSAQQKVAMMRNIEKMIHQALNNADEMPDFMQAITLGRYT